MKMWAQKWLGLLPQHVTPHHDKQMDFLSGQKTARTRFVRNKVDKFLLSKRKQLLISCEDASAADNKSKSGCRSTWWGLGRRETRETRDTNSSEMSNASEISVPNGSTKLTRREIIEKVRPSVCQILLLGDDKEGGGGNRGNRGKSKVKGKHLGSGFIRRKHGFQNKPSLVVTAAHIFEDLNPATLKNTEFLLKFGSSSGGKRGSFRIAKLKSLNTYADVAVLELVELHLEDRDRPEGSAEFEKNVTENRVEMGDPVFCIGTPNFCAEECVVEGICVQPKQRFPELWEASQTPPSASQKPSRRNSSDKQNSLPKKASKKAVKARTPSEDFEASEAFENSNTNSACTFPPEKPLVEPVTPPPRMLQLSIPTIPGMSGAPVFNASGEIVGLLTQKFLEFGLALPIELVECCLIFPEFETVMDSSSSSASVSLSPTTNSSIADSRQVGEVENTTLPLSSNQFEFIQGGRRDVSSGTGTSSSINISKDEKCCAAGNAQTKFSLGLVVVEQFGGGQLPEARALLKEQLLVESVAPNSVSSANGISENDVIEEINGEPAYCTSQLVEAIWKRRSNANCRIRLKIRGRDADVVL